jgi:hypothetical protein
MPLPRSSKRNKKMETSFPAIFFKCTSLRVVKALPCLCALPTFRRFFREHNTYSDQSGMSTTEAADLAADLARVAGGDA